jgi:hypothetical protein
MGGPEFVSEIEHAAPYQSRDGKDHQSVGEAADFLRKRFLRGNVASLIFFPFYSRHLASIDRTGDVRKVWTASGRGSLLTCRERVVDIFFTEWLCLQTFYAILDRGVY